MCLWNDSWNLGFLCVLSICEVCFYQRFKASVSPLTQVEHKDKKKHQKTNEDAPQSGAQHEHGRPTVCVCQDELQAENADRLEAGNCAGFKCHSAF